MKKLLFIFTLIFIGIISIGCSGSDNDDVKEPYTAFTFMPSAIQGTWKYKVGGSENIDAILTFEQKANNEPYMDIKVNKYTYSGKPYYPTSGGDGAIYFKLKDKSSYSKISWNKVQSDLIVFKIENVENYIIEKQFLKSY